MLDQIIKFFNRKKAAVTYKIAPQTIFQDSSLAAKLYEEGFAVVDFLNTSDIASLSEVFVRHYTDRTSPDGAFVGVISQAVHDDMDKVLKPKMNEWFLDYMNINAFVAKVPGRGSHVPLHQDVAAIDENKYSSVNVWMALQDVTAENGPLYLVPRSHHIFFPYRCSNIDAYTKNIESTIGSYFMPVYLKAGQALIFDSRLFHFSPPNLTNNIRVIANCRIFPQKAKMLAYYRDRDFTDPRIEVWQCQDDYLIYKNSYDETRRPPNAKLEGYIDVDTAPISTEEFERRRQELRIEQQPDAELINKKLIEILQRPFAVGYKEKSP